VTSADDATSRPEFTRVGTDVLYDGRFRVVRTSVRGADGTEFARDTVVHPGAVAIVAVDDADRIALVRQYRASVDRFVAELPAGTLEAGEDPVRCAQRELAEETGWRARRCVPLASFVVAPGWCDERVHCFVATGLEEGARDPQSAEEHAMRVDWVAREALLRMIDAGEVEDAKTILGILMYERLRHGSELS
jgi:ADP-ribose pyrophosphatase